jgi:ribose transport system ATP-binding protein
MSVLSANGLSKRFGGIVALSDASFSAVGGEVHALLGENGAGKSTFIQILAGVLRQDVGRITLDGTEYQPANADQARSHGIVTVFQELSSIPDLTVEGNIWFRREPRTLLGTVDRVDIRRQTEALFERFEFPSLDPSKELRRLSLGERQVVEIAKALSQEPRILVLDEATSSLAARETDWLLGLTRRLAGEGRLVVFISHRMGEVRAVADRLTIFRGGRTVAAHVASAVSDEEIVTEMIGRRLERLYPERVSSAKDRVAIGTRDFSGGPRLPGVTFDLHEGEVLGVGGLQGHGQRELFQGLFGISRTQGEMMLWGKAAAITSPRHALVGRDGIALVPEERRSQGLMLSKTVRENLTLSVIRRISGRGVLSRPKEAALTKEMIDFLRIKVSTPEQHADTLSGGNQQKIIIGKMLLTEARVLLLYDPTRGVDVGTKSEIFQLMRDLAGRGYAILFYSSDLQELVNVADRVLVLREGRVAATLAGDQISEGAILRAAMFDQAA